MDKGRLSISAINNRRMGVSKKIEEEMTFESVAAKLAS